MQNVINLKNNTLLPLALLFISILAMVQSIDISKTDSEMLNRTYTLLNLSKNIQTIPILQSESDRTRMLAGDAGATKQANKMQEVILENFIQLQKVTADNLAQHRQIMSIRTTFEKFIAELNKSLTNRGGLSVLGPSLHIVSDGEVNHLYSIMIDQLRVFDGGLQELSQQQQASGHFRSLVYEVVMLISLLLGAAIFLKTHKGLRKQVVLREQAEEYWKSALTELKHQKLVLDQHAIVAVTDVQGCITYVNAKFFEVSGYTHEELIGQDHKIINSGQHPKGFFKEMYDSITKGETWHNEVCNRAKDGHLYWLKSTVVPFMNSDGKPESYICISTDISQRKSLDEKNHRLAYYDTLTSLPNRHLFMENLSKVVAASKRHERNSALLLLDLDNFKTLNETQGHVIGDLLLQQVATRLSNVTRESDIVARFGGDEFFVLLEDLSEDVIEAAGQTEIFVAQLLDMINRPYPLKEMEYVCTFSIGVTMLNSQTQSEEDLLKQADIAMYQAKKAGRNALRFFDPKVQDTINGLVSLEKDMRQALNEQQFQLHYQIQVGAKGQPIGAEALIRWRHPVRGMISPFHFIPLAEESGLIIPIGAWVLDTAGAQLALWQQNPTTSHLELAVNVSAKQFKQADFVTQVGETIARHKINPEKLKIELTESMLVENIDDIIAKMNELNAMKVRFSLDDFGTGYSSLQYLKKLPLSQLKIDQSFVRDITTDSSDVAIVRTIIAMARAMNLGIIAEGVETDEQLGCLRDFGCDHYQGYLFAKPMPIKEFEVMQEARLLATIN